MACFSPSRQFIASILLRFTHCSGHHTSLITAHDVSKNFRVRLKCQCSVHSYQIRHYFFLFMRTKNDMEDVEAYQTNVSRSGHQRHMLAQKIFANRNGFFSLSIALLSTVSFIIWCSCLTISPIKIISNKFLVILFSLVGESCNIEHTVCMAGCCF